MASCTITAGGLADSSVISLATSPNASRRRPVIASRTPSRASSRAIARPIPALAPVTSAVRPLSCRSRLPPCARAWPGVEHFHCDVNATDPVPRVEATTLDARPCPAGQLGVEAGQFPRRCSNKRDVAGREMPKLAGEFYCSDLEQINQHALHVTSTHAYAL